jgi:hypothetical protein
MSFGDDVSDREPAPTDPLTAWPAFADAVRARLEQGRAAYGSATFERPLVEIADELGAELLDQAAYAFIGWVRLRKLCARAARFDVRLSAERAAEVQRAALDASPGRLVGAEEGAQLRVARDGGRRA